MRYYSEDHQWVDVDGVNAVIGISAYAVSEIGDVNFVEPLSVGAKVAAGCPLCVIESMKAAADVNSPVTGTVTAFNERLCTEPDLLSKSPEGEGWICKVTLDMPEELEVLMSEDAYRKMEK